MGRTDAHWGLVAFLGGAAVLVVEDDADVRDAMRLLFENLGARVIEAADGADALAQLDTTSPDLLVSDLAMPRLDGAALIRRLRRAAETAGLPAIAVSAVASAGDAAAPTRGGFDAQLAKPFDEVSLWAALQEVMRRRPSLLTRRLAHLRGSAQQERRRAREVRQRAGAQLAAPRRAGRGCGPAPRSDGPARAARPPRLTPPAGRATLCRVHDDLAFASASAMAAAVRAREVSPVDLVEGLLRRIEGLNPVLNAYCTVTGEEARAAARRAETAVARGEPLGRLHGVPVSVKDTLWTAGVRTTMGSALYADFVPAEDALVVARLRAAGAILLGKTTTPEFAFKGQTDSPLFGVTRNPWSLAHTPGGSTGGGAAAVAAGLGPLAVGTDEGGSIRLPASFCGVVGLKPSFGLVPRVPVGVAELLTHLGPLARTVEDCALFLTVTAGRDDRDGWSAPAPPADYGAGLDRPPGGLRVAWSPRLGYAAVDPEVLRVTGAAVARLPALGWSVEEADPGFEDPAAIQDAFRYPPLAAALGERLPADRGRMDPGLVALIERGQGMSGADVGRALMGRHTLWAQVARFFQRHDLLATPAVAVPPFRADGRPPVEIAGRAVGPRGWIPFTYPFNLTGQPAIVVPCGWTAEGLPIGLQLVGRRFDDALVLRAAAALEATWPWADRRPPVASAKP